MGSLDPVREAYGARAEEYIDLVGAIEHVDDEDLELVLRWAETLPGPILDVGCGPGQWTDRLREHGCDVRGLDPTPEFVERARRRYPESDYRVGSAYDLEVPDASLAGVLAWFSLIHTPPDEVDGLLAEIARCVAPGGGLALGFFVGTSVQPFDHTVVTAYHWPVAELGEHVERAGFVVSETRSRSGQGRRNRTHGAIIARRRTPGGAVSAT